MGTMRGMKTTCWRERRRGQGRHVAGSGSDGSEGVAWLKMARLAHYCLTSCSEIGQISSNLDDRLDLK